MSIAENATEPDSDVRRIPLSLNQEFLCLFDKGDGEGPFGPQYNIGYASRVTGHIDVAILRAALDDVVVRHEALRTVVVREGNSGHQAIHPPRPVPLEVRELGDVAAADRQDRVEDLLIDVEAKTYPADDVPLLRAVLGRFDVTDAVLVLVVHHTAADEWSMPLIMRDLAACYNARGDEPSAAPGAAPQFRDYTTWEHERPADDMAASAAYWREQLRDAEVLALPTHFARSDGLPKSTAWQRFSIPAETADAVTSVARSTRSSPFMVFLAAYNVALHRLTGATDIVVMTFSSGRGQARFHDTVGSFFNFVPLRTNLSGCATFRDVIARTRKTCLEAYAHDIPFGQILAEAPALMAPAADDNHAICAFQVFRSPMPAEGDIGGARYTEIRRRTRSQPVGGDIPDGAMWHVDMNFSGDLAGRLGYNTNLYDGDRMAELIAVFTDTVTETVTDPDAAVVNRDASLPAQSVPVDTNSTGSKPNWQV